MCDPPEGLEADCDAMLKTRLRLDRVMRSRVAKNGKPGSQKPGGQVLNFDLPQLNGK